MRSCSPFVVQFNSLSKDIDYLQVGCLLFIIVILMSSISLVRECFSLENRRRNFTNAIPNDVC